MPRSNRLFLALVLATLAARALPQERSNEYRVVGYVAGQEQLPRIDAKKLTALNYAFAHIDAGKVVLGDAAADDFLKHLRALKSSNPHLKILVSIGGWGAEGFSDAAASEAARAGFARSAADLVMRSDIDGVDLDWEYPGLPGPGIRHRDEDAPNFSALLRALRERFDAATVERGRPKDDPYLLTAALADGEFVAHVELGRIHPYLDWIDLMTYDFHNSLTKTTGHHAALSRSATSAPDERSVEHAVTQYLAAGVPARKIIVGVPFYGRAFADVTAQNNGLDQPYGRYAGEYSWTRLASGVIGREGFIRHWDIKAQAPYLWNARTHVFVSYDDPQSLKLKAAFVRAHGLGGMMYWEQSQDADGQLLDVLANSLK